MSDLRDSGRQPDEYTYLSGVIHGTSSGLQLLFITCSINIIMNFRGVGNNEIARYLQCIYLHTLNYIFVASVNIMISIFRKFSVLGTTFKHSLFIS